MRKITTKWWVLAVSLLTAVSAAGGVAFAAAHAKRHRGLSAARILRDQSSAPTRVIVLLRNQHVNLPPTAKRIGLRMAVLAQDQAPLKSSVISSGGKVTRSFRTVNAFAATVSGAERSRLASDSAVAEVLPDAYVQPPDPTGNGSATPAIGSTSAGPSAPPSGNGGQQVCPSDPSKPLVEPEALSIIHAPEANLLATGTGVKVAFVAEGIDIKNKDFIRPDGSRVFIDYRDFSGDGPNAPTSGAEAFGDASSIAAQGTVVHDLSKFVNPAHPLPPGCNVVLRGVAPGASLVGIKVFPEVGGAFTSVILQGMDWAVSQDHVDILNESFGSDPIPDTALDAIKQFNRLAVAAGTTVTVSSGDQGTANTIGSPASDSSAIDVGATTQFQHFAQTDRGGYQLSPDGWVNDNIAEFSSSGFTQRGSTLDLVAPGNESYETCTANVALYSDCTNFAGQPSDIRSFGGTSESAPLTAGVAALVIQAYRDSHGGLSPSPALVKQLILSNADDLDIPSDEQGAGELDALAAVHAAISYRSHTPTGNGRLVSPTQLDVAATAGASTDSGVTVTNDGASTETIRAHLRTLDQTDSDKHGSVTLDPTTDPQFVDQLGVSQAYTTIHFTVPAGVDRLDASIAYPGPTSTVNLTLFDPSGRFTAFTYEPPGGNTDFDHISVRNPPAGTWTGVFFTPADSTGFSGAVKYDLTASRFGTVGSVTPSAVTLAPGASSVLHVSMGAPGEAGDYSRDLELTGSSGQTTVVPVVMRSLVALHGGQGNFAGTITGGNGNGFIAREDTIAFNVPAGSRAVSVQLRLPGDPNTQMLGFLTGPNDQTLGQQASMQHTDGVSTIDIYEANPLPGQWLFTIGTLNPVGGTTTAARFTGSVSLSASPVHATGVPDSSGTVIPFGGSMAAKVTVTNTGNTDMNVFIDPRRTERTFYSLLGLTQTTGLPLPLPGADAPLWIVPTQSDMLVAAAQATAPVTFDWGFGQGDPDLEARSFGDTATGSLSAPELTNGVYFMAPALLGPFSGPASGTVNTGMAAHARVFDLSVSSSTGDPQLADVLASPPPAAPIVVHPGGSATIPVTITATDRRGSVVTGDLFLDDNQAPLGAVNEITAIPYEYTVG